MYINSSFGFLGKLRDDDKMMIMMSYHIPSTNIRSQNYVPWMNSTTLNFIKKKNTLRRKLKKSKSPKEHLATKVKDLRSVIKNISTLFV